MMVRKVGTITLTIKFGGINSKSTASFPVVVRLVDAGQQATGNRSTVAVALSIDSSGGKELSVSSILQLQLHGTE